MCRVIRLQTTPAGAVHRARGGARTLSTGPSRAAARAPRIGAWPPDPPPGLGPPIGDGHARSWPSAAAASPRSRTTRPSTTTSWRRPAATGRGCASWRRRATTTATRSSSTARSPAAAPTRATSPSSTGRFTTSAAPARPGRHLRGRRRHGLVRAPPGPPPRRPRPPAGQQLPPLPRAPRRLRRRRPDGLPRAGRRRRRGLHFVERTLAAVVASRPGGAPTASGSRDAVEAPLRRSWSTARAGADALRPPDADGAPAALAAVL